MRCCYYKKPGELDGKQALLKKVFEHGLVYDGKRFRTPSLPPAFTHNYMKIKEKGLLEIEQPLENLANLDACTASEDLYEHFLDFVRFILTIKVNLDDYYGCVVKRQIESK